MNEIKPEVFQLIAKGESIEQIAQILDESEETIRGVHSYYLRELEAENANMDVTSLTRRQIGKLEAIIFEYFRYAPYFISNGTRLNMTEKIINRIKKEMYE